MNGLEVVCSGSSTVAIGYFMLIHINVCMNKSRHNGYANIEQGWLLEQQKFFPRCLSITNNSDVLNSDDEDECYSIDVVKNVHIPCLLKSMK